MKKSYFVALALMVLGTTALMAQQTDPISTGLGGVISIAGEIQTPLDSVVAPAPNDSLTVPVPHDSLAVQAPKDSTPVVAPVAKVPVWKQKLYYGYNFDIYYHHDSRSDRKENGFSITVEPEIGWKLKERLYLGLRVGGSYQNTLSTYTVADKTPAGLDTMYTTDLRVHQGSWSVTPYARYRLKSMFNDKLGIWIEAHAYTGMDFPSVDANDARGTDYDGLRYSVTYGFQVSPVITYQFNRKSTFQIFFSILSLGYSGSAFFYQEDDGSRHTDYTNDVIVFSGKLKNLIANQFTPGLYGLKFGVQKSF